MNGKALWNRVLSALPVEGLELQTTTGLWFKALSEGGRLIIDLATENEPSCDLSKQRFVSKKDFLTVHSYYARWVSGELGVRYRVSRKSRNTAYIFALIGNFADK